MKKNVSLKNILVSIIKSIDMYNFLLKDHHRRTAIIAYQLGQAYGLEQEQLDDLFLAASLHDIGALSVNERDQLVKVDVDDPEPHEIQGEKILVEFKPFEKISKIIRHHHVVYEDVITGKINRNEVPLECYFLHLADRIDVLLLINEDKDNQKDIVIERINERFGTIFHPILQEVFNNLVREKDFWDSIDNESFHDLLFLYINDEHYHLRQTDIEDLARLFARVIDYKSHWTSMHSYSVSALANRIGELLELSPDICFELKIAGYLHDIGKIGISTEVLDKPRKLSESEYNMMKQHATYSSLILSQISEFENIAKWVGAHHEKRDKSGYPMKIDSRDFTIEMDVLAYADIFSALSEDRPYRKGLDKNEIIEILKAYVPDRLSKEVFDVINVNINDLVATYRNTVNA